MHLNIFDDASIWISETFDKLKNLVDKNFDNPIFWIIMVVVLFAIVCYGVQALNND